MSDSLQTVAALTALNLPLVALVLMRNLQGADTGIPSLLYHAGVIVGWYMFPILLGLSVFTMVLPFKKYLARWTCVVFLSGYIFFLLVDSVVFSIYKFHVNIFWFSFLVQDFHGLGLPRVYVLAAGFLFALILLAEWKLSVIAFRWRRARLLWLVFPVLALLGLVSSQLVHVVAYEKGDYRFTRTTPLLPAYMPLHSHSYAVRYGNRFGVGKAIAAPACGAGPAGLLRFPLAPICRDTVGVNQPPNVVMILLESWRADTMNDQVSPRIADFGRRSTVCRDHFSSGNSTVAGIAGLLFGIHPTYWDALKARASLADNPPLLDVMHDENYDIGVYAKSNFRRHKIQDTIFRDIPVIEDFAGKTADAWDKDMTNQMLDFLDCHRDSMRPFFLFGFYKASHFSYFSDEEHKKFQPSKELTSRVVTGSNDIQAFMNDYRNAVYSDDDLVGQIIDRLDDTMLMDNTIVIITSDHAEEFNDDGANYWGHGSNFTRWQTQVPMIIHLPGREPRLITSRTSHVDIVPTLLSGYFGVTNPVGDYSDGVDLEGAVPALRPLVLASYYNYAFIFGDEVLVSLPFGQKRYKLNDITKPGGELQANLLQQITQELSRFFPTSVQPTQKMFPVSYIDSLKMFSTGLPYTLTNIRTDRGSRSSVALLNIILLEMYNSAPCFEEMVRSQAWSPHQVKDCLLDRQFVDVVVVEPQVDRAILCANENL
ncbi:MAG: sulfatase-like hydrolase/transferase [Candidatus Krumholzibacteria bacterium]|nr:sulfatase-like hydrolase/transferase [Candidatus Krumholzibacteria bacterium]